MINPADKPPFHQKCFATSLHELKIEEVNEKKREIISQLFLLPDFLDAIYYQDQIAAEFFNVGDFGSPILYQDLAILFDKCKGTIYKKVSRGWRGQRRIGLGLYAIEEIKKHATHKYATNMAFLI